MTGEEDKMSNKVQELLDNMILLIRDAHGVYIPKVFYEDCMQNLCDEEGNLFSEEYIKEKFSDLENHENEYYWDVWSDLIFSGNYYLKHSETKELYFFHMDGDLWVINDNDFNNLTDDEREIFWEELGY